MAEHACQAPADLFHDVAQAQPAKSPAASTSALPWASPSILAPQQGIPGLSKSSGSLKKPELLKDMVARSAWSDPTNPAIVAVLYQEPHHPEVQDGTMLAVHRRTREPLDRANGGAAAGVRTLGQSAVAMWDLSRPQTPRALLMCESAVQCCAFGPLSGGSVVICGCTDGTLCVWDTLAQADSHLASPATGSAAHVDAVPLFLPAGSSSSSGLAAPYATLSPAQSGLDEAEAIAAVSTLEPQNGARCRQHGSGPHPGGTLPPRPVEFSVLVVSESGTVSQWVVTLPTAPHGPHAAGLTGFHPGPGDQGVVPHTATSPELFTFTCRLLPNRAMPGLCLMTCVSMALDVHLRLTSPMDQLVSLEQASRMTHGTAQYDAVVTVSYRSED